MEERFTISESEDWMSLFKSARSVAVAPALLYIVVEAEKEPLPFSVTNFEDFLAPKSKQIYDYSDNYEK